MPLRKRGPIGWWSPDPRGVIEFEDLRVSRSLRQSAKRYEVRVDTAFAAVMQACGDPRRPNGWIEARMVAAYTRLFELGWVHSVETYDDTGALVGGLYGVCIGGLFAGESMFSTARDASKVALLRLVEILQADIDGLLDVQWVTPHLASLGATEVDRSRYLRRVREAVARPTLARWPTPVERPDHPDQVTDGSLESTSRRRRP